MSSYPKKPVADAHRASQPETGPNIYKKRAAIVALVIVCLLLVLVRILGGTLRAEEIALLLAVVALLNGDHSRS